VFRGVTEMYLATVDVLDGSFTEEEVDKVANVVRRHKVRLCRTHTNERPFIFLTK